MTATAAAPASRSARALRVLRVVTTWRMSGATFRWVDAEADGSGLDGGAEAEGVGRVVLALALPQPGPVTRLPCRGGCAVVVHEVDRDDVRGPRSHRLEDLPAAGRHDAGWLRGLVGGEAEHELGVA